MSEEPDGVVRQPCGSASGVTVGDKVLWAARTATVIDVASFAGAETYVTVRFDDGKGLPISLRLADLAQESGDEEAVVGRMRPATQP